MSCAKVILITSVVISVFCAQLSADVIHGYGDQIFVRLSTGIVRGYTWRTFANNTGHVFQGVPYALPPSGLLRYKHPVPVQKWSGILNCSSYQAACMSNTSATRVAQKPVSEDCLYMNIFAGTNCSSLGQLCPTIVYIHGGGHNFDSPRMFPPELLVDNFAAAGLVFVTFGYRLGSFGFFNTGTKEAMGNWGMFDMVAAMRWVQQEIAAFGGNPKKVTLMGHSTGSMDVSLFSLTPRVHGLFQQVIAMSGSSVYPTNRLADDSAICQKFAIQAGCATEKDWLSGERFEKILDCLGNKSGEELLLTQRALDDNGVWFLGPRIDGPHGLFPLPPSEMVKTRRPYPYLTGTTKNENFANLVTKYINATPGILFEKCVETATGYEFKNINTIAQACTRVYQQTSDNGTVQIANLLQDADWFLKAFQDAATMAAAGAPVYLYSFDYVKRGMEDVAPWHSMDLEWVMGIHPFEYDDRDWRIQNIYPAYFANFAKYGDPTPWTDAPVSKWKTLRKFEHNYYSINLPQPHNEKNYHYPGINFWVHMAPSLDTKANIPVKSGFSTVQKLAHTLQIQNTKKNLTFGSVASVLLLLFATLVVLALLDIVLKARTAYKKKCQKVTEETPLLRMYRIS